MQAFFDEIRPLLRGMAYDSAAMRAMYATDASIYQILPQGVVVPADEGDVLATVRLAKKYGLALTGRGGATSLAGQTVGAGIQLDFVPHMHRIRDFDPHAQTVTVQPGLVLDELNQFLAPHDLMFAPDVSPTNRATLGGMIGNNSCGMYSVRYGKTIDHVARLKVLLSDGMLLHAGPLTAELYAQKLIQPGHEGAIYRGLAELVHQHTPEIEQRFPKILRRVGGYNLDRLAQADLPNLVDLLVGSEGTLGLTLEATLKLVKRPQARGMALLHFSDLLHAVDCVPILLESQPVAIELMDDLLLRLTNASHEYGPDLRSVVHGQPAAILVVEYWADSLPEVRELVDRCAQHSLTYTPCTHIRFAMTPPERAAIKRVRKASQPLLMAYGAGKKPQTCVEDSAVAPEQLGAYVREFQRILADHAVEASFYGHASVGLLHVRPLLDITNPTDQRKLRSLSEAICELVLGFGGALSGEHGDGLLRSEFNQRIFGTTIYQAFQQTKALFDPINLFNPGKITAAEPLEHNLRPAPQWQPETVFRFAETNGIVGAVEACNGNGVCRKTTSGTMCPSYMATRAEQHSTRGRANVLRAIFSGAIPQATLAHEHVHEVLDLCLECKACTSECPSGVNMTRLKSEALHQRHQAYGVPLRARFFANARTFNKLGSRLAPLANWPLTWKLSAILQEKLFGIARQRRLPRFARQSFLDWWQTNRSQYQRIGGRSVVFFPDSWTIYNEPELGQAAVRVLAAAGYDVIVPARVGCCGRPAFSKGLLDQAKAEAEAQLIWLAPYAAAGLPIIGIEPSCILSFRDEYPDLFETNPLVQALAKQTCTIEEFITQEMNQGYWQLHLKACSQPVVVHQHCHAKALSAAHTLSTCLQIIPDIQLNLLDAGCCGMAGSFGYEVEHYTLSQTIGAQRLFPAIENNQNAIIVAPGTSCRHHIREATKRHVLHPVQLLERCLKHEQKDWAAQ